MLMRCLLTFAWLGLAASCTRVPDHGLELVYAVESAAVAETQRVFEKRLASLEIGGAMVKPRGNGVAVRLPGVSRAESVRAVLEREGRLEVAVVDDAAIHSAPPPTLPAGIELRNERVGDLQSRYLWARNAATLDAALPALAGSLPDGRALAIEVIKGNHEPGARTYLVEADAWPMGRHLAAVEARQDEMGGWSLSFTFDEAGKKAFAELTGRSVQRRIAILLDGRVQSAPLVMEAIPGGRAMMTLGHGRPPDELRGEAMGLMHVLRGGALPAPLRLVSEKDYGPQR